MWAYVWLAIALLDDVVTVAEAVITFAFFPFMVLVVWLQDNNWFRSAASKGSSDVYAPHPYTRTIAASHRTS